MDEKLRSALLPFAKIGAELMTQGVCGTSHPVYEVHDVDPYNATRQKLRAVCLTESGAKAFLSYEAHNLGDEAHVYVESGYRNREWQALRKACVNACVALEMVPKERLRDPNTF